MALGRTLLASCAGWAAFLGIGWSSTQFLSSATPTPPPPPPRLVGIIEPVESGSETILADAIRQLEKNPWLAVEIHQRKTDQGKWSAEGALQRGPNGCARLELTIRSGELPPSRCTMVSDGRVLAQVIAVADRKPDINGWQLPTGDDREVMLTRYGCGGPLPVLRRLAKSVTTWDVRHRRVDERVFVEVTGILAGGADPDGSRVARLTFDPRTSWLERVEWWSDPPESGGKLVFEQEYRQPRLGRELSIEECARVFSYRDE
jgi:hypothetical protein